jgi:hypothetical protein
MARLLALTVVVVALALCALAVDRSNFKRCDESSFCKRNRAMEVSGAAPHLNVE